MTPQVADFIQVYLRKGFARVFEEQRKIAQARIYSIQAYRTDGTRRSRSGQLMEALQSPAFVLGASGSGLVSVVDYPIYMRFLDMKKMGNYRIYNRPLWGILYRQTFNDIRYEVSALMRSILSSGLESLK